MLFVTFCFVVVHGDHTKPEELVKVKHLSMTFLKLRTLVLSKRCSQLYKS